MATMRRASAPRSHRPRHPTAANGGGGAARAVRGIFSGGPLGSSQTPFHRHGAGWGRVDAELRNFEYSGRQRGLAVLGVVKVVAELLQGPRDAIADRTRREPESVCDLLDGIPVSEPKPKDFGFLVR